jgi:hypothetical protein
MKEEDPVKYDELCSELWLVLDERESFTGVENRIGRVRRPRDSESGYQR